MIMDERKYQEEVQEENPVENYFKVRTGKEWMDEAKSIPIRKKLAGDLWFEGENAVLFADSNAGKSILAVQIADSISRGVPLNPLELTADAQKVVYFDFEMESPQFYARYSIDGQNPYPWNRNFIRVEINEDAQCPRGNFTQFICDAIEVVMLRVGAKVGIIDNISFLNDELEKSKAAAPLIKMLKAVKKKNGFSFLILAHTPKRLCTRPITKNDLSGSKQIMNLIDSAFAIGDSRQEINLHYLKQIKSRNAKYLYDKDNVLLCRIIKDSNFLRFEFLGEALEIDHLESPDPMSKEKLVEFIKREYPKGRSARSIAGSSGYSHTTVNRVISDLIREGELKERGSGNVPDVTEFLKVTEVSTVSTSQKMETTEQVENMKCSIPPEQESHKNGN